MWISSFKTMKFSDNTMKKLLVLCLFSSLSVIAEGQNLVPNASFENTKEIRCHWTSKASDFVAIIHDWQLPTGGTADIYSIHADSNCIMNCESTSIARYGRQLPRSGDKMAGIEVYNNYTFTPGVVYREYLEVELMSSLIPGERYYAEMFVSHAEETQYVINNLGMHFSDTFFQDLSIGSALNFDVQIESDQITFGDTNWVKISGEFVANSPSAYLIIGNFKDNDNTLFIQDSSKRLTNGYYYIDDVSVVKVDPNNHVIIDTLICEGDSISIPANVKGFIGWATDLDKDQIVSTDSILTIAPPTNRTFIAYGIDDTLSYAVTVRLPLPNVNLGEDTMFICPDESLVLEVAAKDVIYAWQDGSEEPDYTVTQAGTYWVNVEDFCGESSDTVQVLEKDCDCHILVPNSFTPNQQAPNELFGPAINCDIDQYKLQIYNRWGEQIFESLDYGEKWDGTYENKPVAEGAYVWILVYRHRNQTKRTTKSGTTRVLR
jgi:gliding motility-associated-like protein